MRGKKIIPGYSAVVIQSVMHKMALNLCKSLAQNKDVYRRTIEIPLHTHMF